LGDNEMDQEKKVSGSNKYLQTKYYV